MVGVPWARARLGGRPPPPRRNPGYMPVLIGKVQAAGRAEFVDSYHDSHFHEGLITLKSFPNVLVGFEEVWAEAFSTLCSMKYLRHVWEYCHSKTFYLVIYQTAGLLGKLNRTEQSTKFHKFVKLYL